MAERFTVEHGGSSVADALLNKFKSIGQHLNSKSNDFACILPFWYESRSKQLESELVVLICSIFPDNFRIPIQDLVTYGMGLDLFEDVHDMFSTRRRIHDIITTINNKLYPRKAIGGEIRRALEKDGPLDQYVKMPVGSCDIEKLITSSCPLVFRREIVIGKWSESDWCENCYGLSLVLKKVSEHPVNLEFPKLTVLRLQYGEDSQSIPIDFFKRMKKLCVLSLDLPSLPHSLNFLRSLKTLRLEVPKLEDMSWIGALTNLAFLTVCVSSLADIPMELGQLENLRSLDLRKMNIAYIPPGVLSRLLKLEELYLPLNFRKWGCKAKQCNDYDEWESGEEDSYEDESITNGNNNKIDGGRINASLIEIASHRLYALQICVPKASFWPHKSPIFDYSREFNIVVPHNTTYQPFGEYSVNVLQLTGEACDIKESGICRLLTKAEYLSLTRVQNLSNVSYKLEQGFPQLKKMIISECNELEYVVEPTDKMIRSEGRFMKKLECLHLSTLSNLKQICQRGRWTKSSWFSNLSQISIRFCPKLKHVFPLSIVRGLTFKNIEILDCFEMEGIFYEDRKDSVSLRHCSIEKLELHSLPRLISFLVHKDDKIDGAENDIDQSLTTNEVSVTNNKHVVSHMDMKMYSAFSSRFAVKWFQNLKSVKIAFCDLVKVIFWFEENLATLEAFTSLEVLDLYGLKNLVHIWFQIPPKITSFKNLQLLLLSECECFYLFSHRVAKLLVQLQKVYISRCEKMKEIMLAEDVENEEKSRIVLPQLKLLEIQHMPNLEILFGVSWEVKLPLLESMKLKDCNKMKSFSYGLLKMPKLEGIEVNGSFKLLRRDHNFFTGVPTLHDFTLDDLKIATKNFSSDNILWKEGLATIYKGWIDRTTFAPSQTSTGMLVSVTRYKKPPTFVMDFLKPQVEILGRQSHPNLVKLFGYCYEDNTAAFVHEYIPGHTLDDRLFSIKPGIECLTWDMRIKIAIGVARGINYLHTSEPKVIHGDIKPRNILLDYDYNPKIVDVGVATMTPIGVWVNSSYAQLPVYADPDYFKPGCPSMKTDVYSFGVVLYELMTGLKVSDFHPRKAEGEPSLAERLKLLLSQGREREVNRHYFMDGLYSSKGMPLVEELASKCVEGDPEMRPTMAEVLEKLHVIETIKVSDGGSYSGLYKE